MTTRKKTTGPKPPLAELEFPDDSWPPFRCPKCGLPTLRPLGATITKENADSIQAHDHEAWEPEWIEGVFTATVTCIDASCKEVVAVSGRYAVDGFEYYADDGQVDWHITTVLKPQSFTPPIRILDIPPQTPAPITTAIEAASDLYFKDVSSSANRVRQAVERYLDHEKIAKKKKDKKGKLNSLTLHKRIELLQATDKNVADYLMAAKWIGNAGSHSDDVSREYLDVGLRVLEKILKLKFDHSDSDLARDVKEIIRRKGRPVKMSRRRR